jgi:hypothetical protein
MVNGSIGFIFIHPNTQNIIEEWSNPYDYDNAGNDHGIIAYKNSIRNTMKEIAEDAYERMKKEVNYETLQFKDYSYDL